VDEVPVGGVGLPALVGQFGLKAFPAGERPFVRPGVTNPCGDRMRQMVDTAGTFGTDASVVRCAAMVSAPARCTIRRPHRR
jgi:hypothetical protein